MIKRHRRAEEQNKLRLVLRFPRLFPRFIANQLFNQRDYAVYKAETLHWIAPREDSEHNQRVIRCARGTNR